MAAEITFEDVVLDWMIERDLRGWAYPHGTLEEEKPVKVLAVNDYSSDYAEGDTEGGFHGATEVVIRYKIADGQERTLDIRMGDTMGDLWDYVIRRASWKPKDQITPVPEPEKPVVHMQEIQLVRRDGTVIVSVMGPVGAYVTFGNDLLYDPIMGECWARVRETSAPDDWLVTAYFAEGYPGPPAVWGSPDVPESLGRPMGAPASRSVELRASVFWWE